MKLLLSMMLWPVRDNYVSSKRIAIPGLIALIDCARGSLSHPKNGLLDAPQTSGIVCIVTGKAHSLRNENDPLSSVE
jgi:hypothetical protein